EKVCQFFHSCREKLLKSCEELHLKVRLRLLNQPKTKPLIKLKCWNVLQAGGQCEFLPGLAGLSHDLIQDPAADALALVSWENLDLGDLHGIILFEKLDHADGRVIHLDDR